MLWIENREDEAIPDCLFYEGYQTDKNKDGQTPLMLWIENRDEEDIPYQLYYPKCELDKDK